MSEVVEYKLFEMESWKGGQSCRHLRVLEDDDGWSFLDEGCRMPFENPMQYEKRKIEERLDRQSIERYSEAAGYRVDWVTQYRGACWRFWREDA
jgi:hypothetical protein